MNRTEQSGHPDVRRASNDLHTRTAASLQAFNDAVPYAFWLRRSEIERFTVNLLWATELAPQRRRHTRLGKIIIAFSWITRVRTAA